MGMNTQGKTREQLLAMADALEWAGNYGVIPFCISQAKELRAAAEAMPERCNYPDCKCPTEDCMDCMEAEMNAVAIRLAHQMAFELECVLADYSGKYYDQAMATLSEYRSDMNEIHERISPTFMGEPLMPPMQPCDDDTQAGRT